MKYWSFWCFLSIFSLTLAAMCNFDTRIPVSQNQRSHAEQDHSNPWLLFHILLCPWLGQQLCPQPAYTSGTGSSLWNFTLSQGVTNLCPHPLAGLWCFCREPQRQFSLFAKCHSSAQALQAAQRRGISLPYSLAVALLFGQPETVEMESAVSLRKSGHSRSPEDLKRS